MSVTTQSTSSKSSLQKKSKGKEPAKDPAFFFNQGKRPAPATSPAEPTVDLDSSPTKSRPTKRAKTAKTRTNIITSDVTKVAPFAERLRPQNISDFVGQEHLTGPNSLLPRVLQGDSSASLWGPSGSGKTTLARILAKETGAVLKELSATSANTADARKIFDEADGQLASNGRRTIVFIDEIHRFNQTQQDLFLPHMDSGHIQLVGATLENPSFKLNSTLISRCQVFELKALTDNNISEILDRVIARDKDLTSTPLHFEVTPEVKATITSLSAGDARVALSLLELAHSSLAENKDENSLAALRESVSTSYDSIDARHMISELHNSLRGNDRAAALSWLARMLTAGENPLYIARRLVVVASEDVGLADDHALPLATATLTACQNIGMPECRYNLAHCVAYLAKAPKSTKASDAYNRAEEAAK